MQEDLQYREAVESDLFPTSFFLVGQAAATAVVAVTTIAVSLATMFCSLEGKTAN